MSDIDYLVDRLEEMLQDSYRLPLTGKLLLDEEALLRLIDQLRLAIPAQVREAQQLLQDRDAVLAQADEKAASIISLAQEQADRMVSEASVLTRAEQERRAILERAEVEAGRTRQQAAADSERVRAEADAYALEVLRDLERNLASFQRTIANGIALLKSNRGSQDGGQRPRGEA